MKKLLVVGVIVLFLGLAIAPSINANVSKASIDSELVEFTTEICGLNGGQHTVQLTEEEAVEVEALFDSIRERLNETETREEAEEVFKEAVMELDKYGLLGGLSVKQAQRLVTGRHQNPRFMKLLEKMYGRHQENPDEMENLFCLLVGHTDGHVGSQGPLARTGCLISRALYYFYLFSPLWHYLYDNGYMILAIILAIILFPILLPVVLFDIYGSFNCLFYDFFPLNIGSIVGFGYNISGWDGEKYEAYPAQGWLHTYGLNGYKNWNGEFYGRLPVPSFGVSEIITFWLCYPGASGFTGIRLHYDPGAASGSMQYFLIGSALWIKIGSEPLGD